MNTITKDTWKKLEDGTMELVSSETFEVEGPSHEELIAQKEEQLLKIYEELQSLKTSQQD